MPAFFVHGVPETHRLWEPVIERLGRKDIIAIDLPGFSSAVPDGFDASKEAYVDWLITRIQTVGEPVDLVAHDWGAIMTLRVASVRPDLVRSWAGGGCAIKADHPWHPLARVWQTQGEGEAYFADLDRAAMRTRLLEDGSSSAEADRIVADVDDRMGDCILRLYRSALNVGREWQPGLANITAPTLVLHGLKDRPVPSELAKSLANDIRAREVLLLDAGHWYPLQRPVEMARALNTFWSS